MAKAFLGKRMKELREKNGVESLQAMADRLLSNGVDKKTDKSTLSRAEGGKLGENKMKEWAEKYCKVFGLTELQTKQFFRSEKIAIPDTSALMKNTQLIDELNKEYSKVVIPDIVLNELDGIKNKFSDSRGQRAWEIIRGIGYGDRIIRWEYNGEKSIKNDEKIILIAKSAAEEYGCEVNIITDDADYSAFLKGNEDVTALHLREYMATKQSFVNMTELDKLDKYYADSYDNIKVPDYDEINASLPNGYTLIISAVRNKSQSLERRKGKILWLISNGADVNKRDEERRYFPPLSHAIQLGDFEMFSFLLNECNANPNIGSRNPHDSGKVRQKNEGNMPLMIAAWSGKTEFVKALCDDDRISLNQQDANGFTALIKACCNGYTKCRDILIEAGADTRITDIDGLNAEDHYNNFLERGPLDLHLQQKRRRYK